jgi:hypothetical protein
MLSSEYFQHPVMLIHVFLLQRFLEEQPLKNSTCLVEFFPVADITLPMQETVLTS